MPVAEIPAPTAPVAEGEAAAAPAKPAEPAAPEATPEQTAVMVDLHWLIHQGARSGIRRWPDGNGEETRAQAAEAGKEKPPRKSPPTEAEAGATVKLAPESDPQRRAGRRNCLRRLKQPPHPAVETPVQPESPAPAEGSAA